MGKPWSTQEINYLAAHCTDGKQAIAEHLGRTESAVSAQASKYGISLRRRWWCCRCSRFVFSPLSPKYGWCRECSVLESRDKAAQKNCEIRKELEAEKRRVEDAERARQAIYSDTDRIKRNLKRLKGRR